MQPQNCITPDIAAHPGRVRVMKKNSAPVRARFAPDAGVMATREGPVAYRAGDALLTGPAGEQWPVARSRFMDTYVPLPPAVAGGDGLYVKKNLPVWALRMAEPFRVAIAGGVLSGLPGDWLVQYAPAEYGVVAASIFASTYAVLPGDI